MYQEISRRGHYANYDEVGELVMLCHDLALTLPPHKQLVAGALATAYETIQENFDELAPGPTKWGLLDAAMLEAVSYVAKDGDPAGSARIISTLNDARRAWAGE